MHSAGILDDGILAQLDWERFSRVFAPKVYGSWLLHECTKSLDLDFFVLQSSLLSLLGSAGQANYSAGNTFLDSLSAHRRSAGLPATAINWSAWSEGGLATRSGTRGEAMWSSLGVKFVSPDLAMQAFDRLMQLRCGPDRGRHCRLVYLRRQGGQSPFLAELLHAEARKLDRLKSSAAKARSGRSPVPVNGDVRQQLLTRLQQRIMAELGFAEPIDPDRPLNEIGLDSLRSVTLANNLEDEFGILISISELISGPTINQLSEHLSGLFAQRAKDEAAGFHSAMPPAAAIRAVATNPPSLLRRPIRSPTLTQRARAETEAVENGMKTETARCIILMPDKWKRCTAGRCRATETGRSFRYRSTRSPEVRVAQCWQMVDCAAAQSRRQSPLVLFSLRGRRPRVFSVPGRSCSMAPWRSWQSRRRDAEPGSMKRAVDDLDTFVERLLPEMAEWLDRPSAFFGHCLGGLTMFATLCALPDAGAASSSTHLPVAYGPRIC